tara:strand:+ start:1307 stop:1954 length:648 start_codon:yes stop_codon:yes gene_type:complete
MGIITHVVFALMLGSPFPVDVDRVACPGEPPQLVLKPGGPPEDRPIPDSPYFPAGVFDFTRSCHLNTLWLAEFGEAPLVARPGVQEMRFIWMRSFHAPMIFRASIRAGSASSMLVWKRAGRGNRYHGDIASLSGEIELSGDQSAELLELANAAVFCEPTESEPPMNDGAYWIFELANDREYCFHEIQSPSDSAEYDLGRVLIDLSGIEIPEDDIY